MKSIKMETIPVELEEVEVWDTYQGDRFIPKELREMLEKDDAYFRSYNYDGTTETIKTIDGWRNINHYIIKTSNGYITCSEYYLQEHFRKVVE